MIIIWSVSDSKGGYYDYEKDTGKKEKIKCKDSFFGF